MRMNLEHEEEYAIGQNWISRILQQQWSLSMNLLHLVYIKRMKVFNYELIINRSLEN